MATYVCNDCGSSNVEKVKVSTSITVENPINKLFNIFYESINPAINFGHGGSRKAAQWLIDHIGLEESVKLAEYACSIHGTQYAPTITTPYQLKEKLSALKAHFQQNNQPTNRVIKIPY